MKEKEKIKIEELFPKIIYLLFVFCIVVLVVNTSIVGYAAETYYYQVHKDLIIPSTNPYTNANFMITHARSSLGNYQNGVLLIPMDTNNYVYKYKYNSSTGKYMVDVYSKNDLNTEILFEDYIKNHNIFLLKNSDGSRFKVNEYSFTLNYTPIQVETNNTYWELIPSGDAYYHDFYPLYINQKYVLSEETEVMEFNGDFFYFPQMTLGKMADSHQTRTTVVSLVKSLVPCLILPIVLVIGFRKSWIFLKKNLI